MRLNKFKKGSSIIETIFYIVILAMLSIAVVNAMIAMTRSFKENRVQREIIQSAEIIEKISREIRDSRDINTITSSSLTLAKDSNGNTAQIVLENSNVRFLENGSFVGNLNSPNISVEELSFTEINTTNSKAVKVSITVRALIDSFSREYSFYNTIVLRGSY